MIKSQAYYTKKQPFTGTSVREVYKKARVVYNALRRKTRRQPYIRSAYFNKQKIFFDYYWVHINQKRRSERLKRLSLFSLAIEVIQNTRHAPISKDNPNNSNEILHRFVGEAKNGRIFYVQIKEDKKRDKKYFMSAFWEVKEK